jgi:hypothetical protein
MQSEPVICMPTLRRLFRPAFRCGVYEAEDVLAETCSVDLIELEPAPGFRLRETWQRRIINRDPFESMVSANPGLRRVRLGRDYDLFVAVCQKFEDVLYVNAVDGWKDRCKASVCWIDELWAASIPRFCHWMRTLERFDYV